MPTSFARPKRNTSTSSSRSNSSKIKGWTEVGGKAKIPYKNAAKICEAKGNAEGRAYLSGYSSKNTSTNCYGYGYNSFSCRTQGSGGFWGGMKEAQDKRSWRSAAKELANSVAIGCMAEYGWIKD